MPIQTCESRTDDACVKSSEHLKSANPCPRPEKDMLEDQSGLQMFEARKFDLCDSDGSLSYGLPGLETSCLR